MRHDLWLRISGLGLAMLLAFSISGAAIAYQTGDGNESEWTQLGEDFGSNGDSDSTTIPGDTYVLPSSGVEVLVGEGVTADNPAESDFADQVIVSTPGGIGAVAVISVIGYPVNSLEAYVSGFAESMDSVDNLDLQDDRDVATGIYLVTDGGLSMYMYISVDAVTLPGFHIVEVVVAPADALEDSLTLLRANVRIDGAPMFADVDDSAVLDVVMREESN